jgi:hypothetical protein
MTATPFTEKAYIRISVIPGQTGSTVIRGDLLLWEM